MTTTLILFYGVFLAQIYFISYYLPMRLRRRVLYVLKNYPPAEYPKLYPKPYDYQAEKALKSGLVGYRNINLLIAAIGLGILVWAFLSDYNPSPLGGDEIFVMMYFVLQMIPIFLTEFKSYGLHKRMREANIGGARKADLNPRRLFDFVSPYLFGLAVILFFAWMAFFLYSEGLEGPWRWEVYVTVVALTASNLLMAAVAAKNMLGKKIDPHLSNKDRLDRIETIVRASVLTSIAISIFMFMTNLADTYAWELYDPVMTSVYFQVIVALSFLMGFRKIKVEAIDFEVYRKDKPPTPA